LHNVRSQWRVGENGSYQLGGSGHPPYILGQALSKDTHAFKAYSPTSFGLNAALATGSVIFKL